MQLLPQNSSLVYCIRAYQIYRIVIGLRCMTDRRLEHLKEVIKDYKKYCSVSKIPFFSSLLSHLNYNALRKYQRNSTKALTFSSSTMFHISLKRYVEKVPPITLLRVRERGSNKKQRKHICSQTRSRPRNR